MEDAEWPLRLPAGAAARLQYGPRFGQERLQLLEVDEDTLAEITARGVVIKGAPNEEAVLCTDAKTFLLKQVETSNTLLLIPPREDGDVPMAAAPAAADDGGGAEPGRATQAARLAAADCGAPVVAHCSASAHFELLEVAPPVGALAARLAAAAYGERHEARGGGAGGAHPPQAGYTWEELLAVVQCSRAQLADALRALHALQLHGRWLTVEPAYLRSVLDVVILTAGAHGWALSSFPRDEMVSALEADGYEAAIASHCLDVFGGVAEGGAWALAARPVCTARARALLEGQPRWRTDEFVATWRAAAPEGMEPLLEWLRGEALLDPSGIDPWLTAFSARDLPTTAAGRFEALFAQRPRWTRADIEPYLEGVEEAGATADGLLLAWCRFSQPTPDATGFYTARSTC